MNRKLGAHEIMEMHEVLSTAVDGINQFQLYRPHVRDQQLLNILDHQLHHMTQEYNNMVSFLANQGIANPAAQRTIPQTNQTNSTNSMNQMNQMNVMMHEAHLTNQTPTYGLHNPAPESPNQSIQAINDRDVASGMLGCHKASAKMRMNAALEFADPLLRRMVMQGANACAEQAYEVFHYMNQKGYYQVPAMHEHTAQTLLSTYQPVSDVNMGQTFQ